MRLLIAPLSVFLTLTATATAQPPRVRIDAVRIGFPAGLQPGEGAAPILTRAGAWAPVYVDLTVGPAGFRLDEARVVVQTTDNDDILNNYTVPVPPTGANEQIVVLTYVRPGTSHEVIKIRVQDREGRDLCREAEQTPLAMEPGRVLILQVGATLPGLRQMLTPPPNLDSRVTLGTADHIDHLPEHWFAYEAVDLVLFTTSNRDFLTSLLDDKDPRVVRKREALAEWVRRGGKMVVSVGRNQDVVAQFPPLATLLPVTLHGTQPVADLPLIYVKNTAQQSATVLPKLGQPVEIVQFKDRPGKDLRDLVWTEQRQHRLGVQAGEGLGQVSVVAFDWNQPPFTTWPDMKAFWKALLQQNGAYRDPNQANTQAGNYYGQTTREAALLGQLQVELENFQEVPVIPFGWVALFIVLYILIVGPLEYLILKKVFGRLELTWITFPSIVIFISVIAYFAAYWLKGDDLRINKVDVVEVDLAGQRAYGTSWFTLFSPRIQHYTIGVEPAAGWVQAGNDPKAASVVVSWLGAPDYNRFGRRGGRGRSPGLFSRAYDYESGAVGLNGVPIQVWSTKSFTASWQAPLSEAAPLVTAELRTDENPRADLPFTGRIVSHLPAVLEDAVLIYSKSNQAQEIRKLGTLQPGQEIQVQKSLPLYHDWATVPSQVLNHYNYRYNYYGSGPVPAGTSVKMLLFPNLIPANPGEGNLVGSTGAFDQTWRLLPDSQGQPTQVMLYGRLAAKGHAEPVTAGSVSASRLWLGELPGPGKTRPALTGELRQETFVRVFIPLTASGGR